MAKADRIDAPRDGNGAGNGGETRSSGKAAAGGKVSWPLYAWFWTGHAVLVAWSCSAFLFHFRPDILNWWGWLAGIPAVLLPLLASPFFPKPAVFKEWRSYFQAWSRRRWLRLAVTAAAALSVWWMGASFRELRARFTYVALIKEMTGQDGGRAMPYGTAADLAAAYSLYPHRREAAFIAARTGRFLASNDRTADYNRYVEEFLKRIDVPRVLKTYRDARVLARHKGCMDPVLYLTRLEVEAAGRGPRKLEAMRSALERLKEFRPGDDAAALLRMVYGHELAAEEPALAPPQRKARLSAVLDEINAFLDGLPKHDAPGTGALLAGHLFQEVLDHGAQLRIDLARLGHEKPGAVEAAYRQYERVMTTREQIAGPWEVPWLEGPGKLTVYQYFKHRANRTSDVTDAVMASLGGLRGLRKTMDARLYKAFPKFQDIKAWDLGTPFNPAFNGTGTHNRITEWLKSGW